MHRMVPAFARIFAVMAAALFAASVAPATAQAPSLAMLGTLERGGWELRFRPDDAKERVCLRDGRELIQLRHPMRGCSHFIVEDTADRVTVQYTCRGHGYGRTRIWRENGRLAQIESQGIVDGRPFQFSAEARRTGRCAG